MISFYGGVALFFILCYNCIQFKLLFGEIVVNDTKNVVVLNKNNLFFQNEMRMNFLVRESKRLSDESDRLLGSVEEAIVEVKILVERYERLANLASSI